MSQKPEDEYFSGDLVATQLEVVLYTTDERHNTPFGVEEFEEVMDLLEEYGFWISEQSYETTILTGAFVTTDENMQAVREIKSTLEERYPDHDVEATVSSSNRHAGEDFFTKVQMIVVD